MYSIQNICEVINGSFLQHAVDASITELVYDSRKIQGPSTSLFFALISLHNDGHKFIGDAYKKGVRNFVVSKHSDYKELHGSNIITVDNTVTALQKLATHHRRQFNIPVIGITGSNGKTIVKEWLYQLLHQEHNIVRSPRSFNSQIGVPLSVWQLAQHHTLGIFEAGISLPREMKAIAEVIQPTIGIITNIGEAHGENFSSALNKLEEKIELFNGCKTIIYPANDEKIDKIIRDKFSAAELFSWGKAETSSLKLKEVKKKESTTLITVVYNKKEISFTLPFTDDASINNALTCCCVMLLLQYNEAVIADRISKLHPVEMRLQLNKGINNCTVINDSYSADLTSLYNALNFLEHQASHQNRAVILSDFMESGKADNELYESIAQVLKQHNIKKVFGIGNKIKRFLPSYLEEINQQYFIDTDDFIKNFKSSGFKDEVILIKGARVFGFERIVQLFEQKVHQTLLEINLNAIAHNLKEYQKLLQPGAKLMAMVKAFAYGSGGAEIAGVLQFNNVDYLGVAYADEGVDLRRAGINVPILVMNADESSFPVLTEYNLQPVIYSFEILNAFENFLSAQGSQKYPVHIEIETGMNRLGFTISEIPALGAHLKQSDLVNIESVFTHLAASDNQDQDDYTEQQASLFSDAVDKLQEFISYPFLKHISNSAAIIRLPRLQMDMVRLGIGLYGVEISTDKLDLQPAATLKSTIAQLKHLKAGETVSYNRKGVLEKHSVIATVRIGYADGYSRKFGNGVGKMWLQGRFAPVVGTVCMDMTMIDVTDIPGAKVGDEVIIFGKELPVQDVADWIDTIPYEIMTSVSQRVKRIYFHE